MSGFGLIPQLPGRPAPSSLVRDESRLHLPSAARPTPTSRPRTTSDVNSPPHLQPVLRIPLDAMYSSLSGHSRISPLFPLFRAVVLCNITARCLLPICAAQGERT